MLLIQEDFVNETENARFGYSDPIEPYTQDIGELFRSLRRENGRCTGHVYIDTKSQGTLAIGWVFVKRDKYSNSDDTYLRTAWVTLFDECEHGDEGELTQTRGRKKIATGLKHRVLKRR